MVFYMKLTPKYYIIPKTKMETNSYKYKKYEKSPPGNGYSFRALKTEFQYLLALNCSKAWNFNKKKFIK